MRAFDLLSAEQRDSLVTILRDQDKVLLLPSGTGSIRFRPALTVTQDELTKRAQGNRTRPQPARREAGLWRIWRRPRLIAGTGTRQQGEIGMARKIVSVVNGRAAEDAPSGLLSSTNPSLGWQYGGVEARRLRRGFGDGAAT